MCVVGRINPTSERRATETIDVEPAAGFWTKTSSPRPRPAGCRSDGNAITRVAPSTRLLLVHLDHAVRLGVGWRGTAASTLGGHGGPSQS